MSLLRMVAAKNSRNRRAHFGGVSRGVDEFFLLRARPVELARSVDADPARIGVLSTGEACAVALLFSRLDLLDSNERHPLDDLDRLGPKWEKAVRDLHASDWRQ